MDDSGFPRTPDRLPESFGTRARRSEVFEIMMSAGGPLNSGGSATAGIRARFPLESITVFNLKKKLQKLLSQTKFQIILSPNCF